MNLQRFLSAALAPRQLEVEVPELAGVLFDDGEKPVWTVRGLTAAELGRAKQASEEGLDTVKALVEAMAGDGDKAAQIRKAFGLGDDDVPQNISYRIELLAAGSVSPALGTENRDVAVKLAEAFPTVFYDLTNKVLTLTGQGAVLGKPKRSGKTTA
jgi:hypothetical protein